VWRYYHADSVAKLIVSFLALILAIMSGEAAGQITNASRPLSATVVSTFVTHNGELALLVLWRGSPGWFSGGGGNRSSGGGSSSAGQEFGSFSMTYAGKTFAVDLNYTTRVARVLEQDISMADTNVVLVDFVDAPSGARIVGRHLVDPKLPEAAISGPRTVANDPAIIGIRRSPEAKAFLQCEIPMPMPAGADAALDPAVRLRLSEYVQGIVKQICDAALSP